MQKQIKICDVVQGANLPEFLNNLEHAQASSAMVELRADSVKGFKAEEVKMLAAKTKVESIFTCRSVREGGNFSGSFDEQETILKLALAEKFNHIDITFDNPMVENLSPQQKKKLITSYHNFNETPASIEIMTVFERMREVAPAIMKIATLVKNSQDIFTLTEILKQRRSDEKLIVIGMGDTGKLTRIMFPLMGSYLTYASSDNKTAPGIMTRKEMESIYNIITKA